MAYINTRGIGNFLLVFFNLPDRATSIVTTHALKFGDDVIFCPRHCRIIHSYLPDGADSTRTGELRWDTPRMPISLV